MNTRLLVCCLLSYACLSACSHESHGGSDSTFEEQISDSVPKKLKRLDDLMARDHRGLVIPASDSGPQGDRHD